MQGTQTASLDTSKSPVYVSMIVLCFVCTAIPFENSTGKPNKEPRVTEKNESSHQRHNRQHNDAKVTSMSSLLDLPVELPNGIAV